MFAVFVNVFLEQGLSWALPFLPCTFGDPLYQGHEGVAKIKLQVVFFGKFILMHAFLGFGVHFREIYVSPESEEKKKKKKLQRQLSLSQRLFKWAFLRFAGQSSFNLHVHTSFDQTDRMLKARAATWKVAFSSRARILWERSTIHSPPALFFFFFVNWDYLAQTNSTL